jgi:riboflavin kinase/FMN adenylyltransferase
VPPRIYRSLDEVPADFGPSAITIGNFDGLHAGHRRIMRRVVEIAREHRWKPGVLTFDPHPTRIVAPSRSPRLLTTTEERARLMGAEGIEDVLVLPFNAQLASLSPELFVEQILVDRLRARAVLVGENFRFGAGQAGDTSTLKRMGKTYGFVTEIVAGVKRHGQMVSSSGIRRLLQAGQVSLAARLLERPYSVEGDIVCGHGVGAKQTVPTLNLATSAEIVPSDGVYASRTYDLESGRAWNSITNIGMRPTFGGDRRTIETFLLDPFDGIAPRRIRLEFFRRLRDERKFESAEALRSQILRDVGRAKALFRRYKRWGRRPLPV